MLLDELRITQVCYVLTKVLDRNLPKFRTSWFHVGFQEKTTDGWREGNLISSMSTKCSRQQFSLREGKCLLSISRKECRPWERPVDGRRICLPS